MKAITQTKKYAVLLVAGLMSVWGTTQVVAQNYNNGYNNGYNNYNNGYNNNYNNYNNGYNNGYNNDYYNNGNYDDRYDNGDYQQFYDDLSPYGSWLEDPTYGYVWRPRVGSDFRPYYSNGYWANTDLGNMWVSNFVWGWISFHYGRWVHNHFYGWLWVPGSTWAPAWVVWRSNSSYYGWAPMGPYVGMNYNWGGYYDNYYDYWNFVPCGYIYSGYYHRHRHHHVNYNFFHSTTIINNYGSYNNGRFFAGPRAEDVRKVTGRDVRTYRVDHVNTRGKSRVSGDRISISSPEIKNSRSGFVAAPRKVSKIESGRETKIDKSVGKDYRSNVRPIENSRKNINSGNDVRYQNRDDIRNNNIQREKNNGRINNVPKNDIRSNPSNLNNNNRFQNNQPKQNIPNNRYEQPKNNNYQVPNNNRQNAPSNNIQKQSNPSRSNWNNAPKNNNFKQNNAPSNNRINTPAPRSNNPSRSIESPRNAPKSNSPSRSNFSNSNSSKSYSPSRSNNSPRQSAPSRNSGSDHGRGRGR